MRGLFLDTSTRTGWALFENRAAFRGCGTKRLPKGGHQHDYGARTWALFDWLERQIVHLKPQIIGYETPFIPFGNSELGTSGHTLRLQIALASTIETVATKHGIRCMEMPTQTCKVALLGPKVRPPKETPKAARRAWWKAAMVAAARRQGWDVQDDNQADACGVACAVFDEIGLNL